jgi:hypothetical protein
MQGDQVPEFFEGRSWCDRHGLHILGLGWPSAWHDHHPRHGYRYCALSDHLPLCPLAYASVRHHAFVSQQWARCGPGTMSFHVPGVSLVRGLACTDQHGDTVPDHPQPILLCLVWMTWMVVASADSLGVCHCDMGFLRESEAVRPQIGLQREADRLHERGAGGVMEVDGHGRQRGGSQLDLDVGLR